MTAITRCSFVAAAALLLSAGRHAIAAATRPAAKAPFRLLTTSKKEDAIEIATEGESVVITVTSPSGIGGAWFERTGASWGKKLTVQLRYSPDRPFKMLEGASASLAKDDKPRAAEQELVYLTAANDSAKGTTEFMFPAKADDYSRLSLSWVDAFRR
jgi:hypothetical protein